jgi:3-phenylpropionate/cinnamic acid dioxygenase small subunit
MDNYRAIERLLYEYAEMIDAGNFEGVGQLLDRAVVASPADAVGVSGAAAVLKLFQTSTRLYPETGTPRTKHVMTNIIVDIDDDGRHARTRSQYTVFQGTDELPLQPIVAGRYHDEFSCDNGQWAFSRRNILVDFIGDVSRHLFIKVEATH